MAQLTSVDLNWIFPCWGLAISRVASSEDFEIGMFSYSGQLHSPSSVHLESSSADLLVAVLDFVCVSVLLYRKN